jgi:hypothetical protein
VTTALDVLNAQLQTSWFMLWGALDGLGDEEYAWEPAPGSWHVRVHPDGFWKRDSGDPVVAPTIAWRMCTLAGTQLLRHDWTFGTHRLQWTDIDLPGSAAGALAFLERSSASWIRACAGLGDADLDKPLCDWPGGPHGRPFSETLWWTNRELIAAGADITLLRDLYRSRPG